MDLKSVVNTNSLKATFDFLREIIAYPTKYREATDILDTLKTQAKLAKYENPEAGIKAMSLNTFKAVADFDAPGGFSQIDSLRRQAIDKLTQAEVNVGLNDSTKASKKREIRKLSSDMDALRAANLVLLRTISKVLVDLKNISDTEDESVRKRLSTEAEVRIYASLSANTPPYDTVNSSSIKLAKILA